MIVDDLREAGGFRSCRHPGAALADIDLDQHVQLLPRHLCDMAEHADIVRVIGDDRDARLGAGLHQAADLAFADHRRGDQDVVDSGGGHDLGLAQLGAADADGAGGDLAARDLRRFMGLGVGPVGHARFPGHVLHAGDIAGKRVLVDHQDGGVELGDLHVPSPRS